jgi:flagellar biosynthesis anti-sigma factor FlgM
MKKLKKQGPGTGVPPDNHNGTDTPKNLKRRGPRWPGTPKLQGNGRLIEQVRRIIAATPEVRPEKVEPLREAVASGTYEIDARKVANCLITKIILET